MASLRAQVSRTLLLFLDDFHSRGHGKIEFEALTKTIASRWKNATQDQKDECLRLVALDRQRYEKEMQEYRTTQAWMQSVQEWETSRATFTTSSPNAPAPRASTGPPRGSFLSTEASLASNDSSQEYSCQDDLEMKYQGLGALPRKQAAGANTRACALADSVSMKTQANCKHAPNLSLEPNTNIDWGSPCTIAELAKRLDDDCQEFLIMALLL